MAHTIELTRRSSRVDCDGEFFLIFHKILLVIRFNVKWKVYYNIERVYAVEGGGGRGGEGGGVTSFYQANEDVPLDGV